MMASASAALIVVAASASPPPFSFSFGGVQFHSAAPAASWETTVASFTATGGRSQADFTWTSPDGLQAQAKQTTYSAAGTAGAAEWVLSFRNTGAEPSPPLCNISALDTVLPAATTVHRFIGSHASPIDYLPLIYPVPAKGAAPAPAPTPGSPPAPPTPVPPAGTKRLVHGNASANEMEDNQRLWQSHGGGSTFPCLDAQTCQRFCAGNQTCQGATWVHPGALGPTPKCYMLDDLDTTDAEVGFSSWSKVPVLVKPHNPAPSQPLVGPRFAPQGGRSSNGVLPYFSVYGTDAGSVYSIGWSGGWEALVEQADDQVSSSSSSSGGVTVKVMHTSTARTGNLCTSMRPGEAFRSMRIIAVPFTKAEAPPGGYNGLSPAVVPEAKRPKEPSGPDQITLAKQLSAERPDAPLGVPAGGYGGRGFPVAASASSVPGVWPQIGFNKHRRIMSQWKLPRDARTGQVKGAIVASWAWIGWNGDQDEAHQLWHVQAVKNTSVEYYWLDAGWFVGGFPNGVGNWQIPLEKTVLRTNWRNGSLDVLGVACHAEPNPVGFIVWFEPERVAPNTYIAKTLPQYVLKNQPNQSAPQAGNGLLNLGDPEARSYIQQYLSSAVEQYGLDVLRMDYNLEPGPIWAASDEAGRSGMREAKYINGLYTMWDSILATHPGLVIDDCSSGGRRIDIETLSRSFPLWRSDNGGGASASGAATLQVQTMGLTQLAPISSGAVWDVDPYQWRTAGVFGKTISWGLKGWRRILANETLVSQLELAVAETRSLRPFMLEDYYPLTHTNTNLSQWAAYQFHRGNGAEGGEAGFAMYFRRPESTEPTMAAGLLALTADTKYTVTLHHGYVASGSPKTMTGRDLIAVPIALEQNGCVLLRYARSK
jgi:hypothetical protein